MSLTIGDLRVEVETFGEMQWVRMAGSLRASAGGRVIGYLAACTPVLTLVVADLRRVEVADSVGASALRRALTKLRRAACLLPPAWSPAGKILRPELAALPTYESPAALSRGEQVILPVREGRERRMLPRQPVRLPAELAVGGESGCAGWTSDLSLSGAWIESDDARAWGLEGRRVRLAVCGLRLRARVVRVSEGARRGLAVEFARPGARARSRLESLMAGAA